LFRLRVALELRRGLSVILGDVGTGKTTLSRKLSQVTKDDPEIQLVMILNPMYEDATQFLEDLMRQFHLTLDLEPGRVPTVVDYMAAIENFLFRKCVVENLTVTLLIDESQKLCEGCLEVLRSLLNYETNQFKTLQLILIGQMELLPKISRIRNFWDRIAFKSVLNPLDLRETEELIHFRLEQAGLAPGRSLFDAAAIQAVHEYSGGYPRKIAMLCHNALEYLVMHEKRLVTREVIDALAGSEVKPVFA
jgi:general secretion pathway protein A